MTAESNPAPNGLLTDREAAALCLLQRIRGGKTVFTNGVFDLLHRGHADYLTQARALGNLLIVGLNSDESTRRLKGEGRPLNSERDRAAVLLALKPVDAVVIFQQDTPEELIRAIKPDVLVKGGDYTAEQIAGAEFVREQGGNVAVLPFVDGFSTTALIHKIHGD